MSATNSEDSQESELAFVAYGKYASREQRTDCLQARVVLRAAI